MKLLILCMVMFTVSQFTEAAYVEGVGPSKCFYQDCPCEEGWNHNPLDDTCNKVFPRVGHFNETSGNTSTGDGTATVLSYLPEL